MRVAQDTLYIEISKAIAFVYFSLLVLLKGLTVKVQGYQLRKFVPIFLAKLGSFVMILKTQFKNYSV